MAESYLTLRRDVEAVGEFVDRKSRFIAQLIHVESVDEVIGAIYRNQCHIPIYTFIRTSDDVQ